MFYNNWYIFIYFIGEIIYYFKYFKLRIYFVNNLPNEDSSNFTISVYVCSFLIVYLYYCIYFSRISGPSYVSAKLFVCKTTNWSLIIPVVKIVHVHLLINDLDWILYNCFIHFIIRSFSCYFFYLALT